MFLINLLTWSFLFPLLLARPLDPSPLTSPGGDINTAGDTAGSSPSGSNSPASQHANVNSNPSSQPQGFSHLYWIIPSSAITIAGSATAYLKTRRFKREYNDKIRSQHLRKLGKETQLNWNLRRPLLVSSEELEVLTQSKSVAVHQYPLTYLREIEFCMKWLTKTQHKWSDYASEIFVERYLRGNFHDEPKKTTLKKLARQCANLAEERTEEVKKEIDDLGWEAPKVFPVPGTEGVKSHQINQEDNGHGQQRVTPQPDTEANGNQNNNNNQMRITIDDAANAGRRAENFLKAGQANLGGMIEGVKKSVTGTDWGNVAARIGSSGAAGIGSSIAKPGGMKWTPTLKPV